MQPPFRYSAVILAKSLAFFPKSQPIAHIKQGFPHEQGAVDHAGLPPPWA